MTTPKSQLAFYGEWMYRGVSMLALFAILWAKANTVHPDQLREIAKDIEQVKVSVERLSTTVQFAIKKQDENSRAIESLQRRTERQQTSHTP